MPATSESKPRLFIGSSSEGKEIASAVALGLHEVAERARGRRLASVRPAPPPDVPFANRRKTVWMIGSSDELSEDQRRFTNNLVDDVASHFARLKIRVVLGESELLRHVARRYRSSLVSVSEFVPNPIIIFGNLRRGEARTAFTETIGYIPDIAIIIGGRIARGRVAEEHDFAQEAGIPVLSIRCSGGAAAHLPSNLPHLKEDKPDAPLSALESAKLAAEIASVIEHLE